MQPYYRGFFQRHSSTVAFIQRTIDGLVIFFTAYLNTFFTPTIWQPAHVISALLAVIIFQSIARFYVLYGSWRGASLKKEMSQVLFIWLKTIALTLFIAPTITTLPFDIQFSLGWFISATVLFLGLRLSARMLIRQLRSYGYNSRSVAIAGNPQLSEQLAHKIRATPWLGLHVSGFYSDVTHQDAETRWNGNYQQLVADAKQNRFDCIYLALPMSEDKKIQQLVADLADTTVSVYFVPEMMVFDLLLHTRVVEHDNITAFSIYESPHHGVNGAVKRIEDIILSSILLMLCSIPMLCIALAVKLTSKGPVLFKQTRYGIGGKPILVYKFRTMTVTENGQRVTQATRNDARITPIGQLLRRSSLDELPQFINVLQGSMSLVGPRPHAVAHNEEYRRLINGYMLRHKVKPGITGWAQVNGWRGETDTLDKMENRIAHDLYYIRKWSLWMDLKIIVLTLFKGFINKNAF